jgi:serine/threonine-protein kinase
MFRLDKDRYRALSPLLDQALDLDADARRRFLADLERDRPDLAGMLARLLTEHDGLLGSDFLDTPLTNAHTPSPSLAGHTVGPYTLEVPLGMGGMGTVWRARRSDGRFERLAAVKFLNLSLTGQGEERFTREGRILGRLTHPHIAQLLDAGVTSSGQAFLVLEYVDGARIDEYCNRHDLDANARIRIFLQVLGALAYAHAQLIVHRDIKPSNVLVGADGMVKLLDFGVAKLLEQEDQPADRTALTRDGGSALTPEYAAPEQLTGAPITTATDVFAAGVLLYVLLSGEHPAGNALRSPADIVRSVLEGEPRRPSDVSLARRRGVVRGDLDTIVLKALKKDTAQRYPSIGAFAEDLRRYLHHEPISARPDTIGYRVSKFVRRNRAAVALTVLAVLAAAAGVVGTIIQARAARTERDFALRQLTRAEAINDLNLFLLTDAAPSGKPFTVNDLLARAEGLVERQHGGDPVTRADLLISIGRQYWSMDEDGKSRRVLTRAYDESRALSDASLRARAACALASVLARQGEIPRAKTLVQDGLRELGDGTAFVLDRVFCLQQGAEAAREAGEANDAVGQDEAALQLVRESPFESELLELNALGGLAESYRVAGRMREANDTYERALGRLAALGRDDTQRAGTLLNNQGLALYNLGRPLEAEKAFRRAIDISSAGASEEAVSPMLLVNHARVLRELGRLDEAADYADRGYEKAKQSDSRVVVNQSLLLRTGIYREMGDVERAAALLAEVEPRLRKDLPPEHIAFAGLTSEHAMLARARGHREEALSLLNRVVDTAEASIKAGRQGRESLPPFLLRRATVRLELNDPAGAVTDARRAVTLLEANVPPGAFMSTLGRGYLTLARALEAQGSRDEARAVARSAASHLAATVGEAHRDTRAASELAK